MFGFMLALTHELQVRDVRAAIMLALLGNERSIPNQPGMSVQLLVSKVGGGDATTEIVWNLLRGLQTQNLVARCGRAQRTHLFQINPEAEKKLQELLDLFGRANTRA